MITNGFIVTTTATVSDGTAISDGTFMLNGVNLSKGSFIPVGTPIPAGTAIKDVRHRVLAQILDPASGKSLTQIGKTGLNPRGRYAVHFHRAGDTIPVSIDGSAVVDSPGWGIVNHSSNVNVTNNVVYNAVGAAYVTEAGDEVGTFDHNIAIKALGSGGAAPRRRGGRRHARVWPTAGCR